MRNALRDKIFDQLNQDYFGMNLEAEIERIKQKCDEAGIAHKDFALRNLISERDSKNNLPLRRKGRPARLMLIDWEPESHSLQRG